MLNNQLKAYMETSTIDYTALLVTVYFLSCIIVAVTASGRGWNGFLVFLVCAVTTPIVGAILYSPYKQKVVEERTTEKEITPSKVE